MGMWKHPSKKEWLIADNDLCKCSQAKMDKY